jgi:hypothetical protein
MADDRHREGNGDILLGRELSRSLWSIRLHVPKVFVIVHRYDGIVVKEVTDHDTQTVRICCHSWNADPEYQDFFYLE